MVTNLKVQPKSFCEHSRLLVQSGCSRLVDRKLIELFLSLSDLSFLFTYLNGYFRQKAVQFCDQTFCETRTSPSVCDRPT